VLNPHRSTAAVNAEADAAAALLNGGALRLYGGLQPLTADAAIDTQPLLAELRFSDPAFSPAVQGTAMANPLTDDVSAAATGVAKWFRALRRNGTVVCDGSVGVSGSDLNLSSRDIVRGDLVQVTALTLSVSAR
jgi:hypothetical protein